MSGVTVDESERGSVQLFMLGLGVSLLLLGGIAFDLWRMLGDRRELAALADAAAIAASSGIDVGAFRTTGLADLDPELVGIQINDLLDAQPESVTDGLSVQSVQVGTAGCDVAVTVVKSFDFVLLDFGRADAITMSATGCASPSQG